MLSLITSSKNILKVYLILQKPPKKEMIFNIEYRNVIYWKDIEIEVKELKSKIRQTVLLKTSL